MSTGTPSNPKQLPQEVSETTPPKHREVPHPIDATRNADPKPATREALAPAPSAPVAESPNRTNVVSQASTANAEIPPVPQAPRANAIPAAAPVPMTLAEKATATTGQPKPSGEQHGVPGPWEQKKEKERLEPVAQNTIEKSEAIPQGRRAPEGQKMTQISNTENPFDGEDGTEPLAEGMEAPRPKNRLPLASRRRNPLMDLNKIQIPLTFELGSVTVQLDELESLQPGYTFTLNHSDDDQVNIRVNGQLIGTGRIVKIENQVGIQLESLQD